MEITTFGAIFGLSMAIALIIGKVSPVYSLILGALLGGLFGGAGLPETVSLMIDGAKDIMPATLRIITAGVLAGVLIESGAASRIARTIVNVCGDQYALFALAVSAMLLTACGVFIDIAVITVSPIALSIAKNASFSRSAVLLAMIGGGKSGNLISPNPNTIAAAAEFQLDISRLMLANLVPAIAGLVFTAFLVSLLRKRGEIVTHFDAPDKQKLPSFFVAIIGPLVAIGLLALRPTTGINVDPLVALPVGGIVGCLAMGKIRRLNAWMTFGLGKMTPVAMLLLGTGTLAGIIKASALKTAIIQSINVSGLPGFLLAPISGVVMSAATASTTAGTTVACQAFSQSLLSMGISALAGAAMIHAGATVLDHLPHGSFFHATAGSVGMNLGDRLKLIPYETAVAIVLVTVSTLIHAF
ncbi:MAG: GntP family permease [Planctomycetaceae bacterium]|nr:GntP family permease [Planctomycetaceae bacterium]